MKLKKWHLYAAMLFLLATPFWLSIFNDSIKEDVKNGELVYSNQIGWINLGHAKPARTKNAYQKLKQLHQAAQDSFDFEYSQQMKFPIAGKFIVADYVEKRRISANQSKEELDRTFIELFKSVSNGFEASQDDFPYWLMQASRVSSFKNGDLTGNTISLYCAMSNHTLEEIKPALQLLSPDSSLFCYDTIHSAQDTSWLLSPTDSILSTSPILKSLNKLAKQLNDCQAPTARSRILD